MRRSIIAALLIAGALALPAASQADPVKIRIAWITIGNPPPVLEAKKDLAHVAADFGFLKEHIDLANTPIFPSWKMR